MADQNETPAAVPYGAWPSPVDALDLVTGISQPVDVRAGGGATWWLQNRPDQGGRQQIVRRDADGTVHEDVLPDGWNARTRVHEYGGAGWWVHDGVVFTVDFGDQRLYRVDAGRAPVPITPVPPSPASLRYADGSLTPDGAWCVCVREAHHEGEVRNEIVAVRAICAPGTTPAEPVVLVSGPDFVAAPRISPDGTRLAWIEWQQPNMPWDTTVLRCGELVREPGGIRLSGARRLSGRPDESLVQPEWGPDGTLFVVSDRSGWWNVYHVDEDPDRDAKEPERDAEEPDQDAELVPVHPVDAEVGLPAWGLGQSRYVVGRFGAALTFSTAAGAHLVTAPTGPGEAPTPVHGDVLPFVALTSLHLEDAAPAAASGATPGTGDHADHADHGPRIVALATSATTGPAVVELRPAATGGLRGGITLLTQPAHSNVPPEAISVPRRIDFPSAGGRTAHALLYLPASAVARGPDGERPPLLVTAHGGPTGAANPSFRLATQFWTTRGFAVVDVDYGGSTGYGRPYRRLLDGAWGVVDVEDVCAAAVHLAQEGLVDPDRMAIRGASAGGFTVLAALATRDVFAAGASHYGVADLAALARDTHKFEARYLDGLVGPWPQAQDRYAERSPLSSIQGFDRPLIVLQGAEDAVVPPAQAEAIVGALAAGKVPHAYLLFAGEQHGFRRAENVVRALEAELSFYAQVFGFEPAGSIEPVPIAFAERLAR